LVIGYGLGMAATLTAAGLLLVVVRDRFGARLCRSGGRVRRIAAVSSRVTPYATAALVVVVGAGLALRSVSLI
jgi:nickel/cobalt exporter